MPKMDLYSPRIRFATVMVAFAMALSAASFAAVAVLWQECVCPADPDSAVPLARREVIGSTVEDDVQVITPARQRSGTWM